MIDTKSPDLEGHKTVVCGRPHACEFIKLRMSKTQTVKIIEVSGFSEAKSIEYNERFFENDPEKKENVKKIIKRPKIRMMASVPEFLWIICLLHLEDFKSRTLTELYIYGCQYRLAFS